MPQRKENAVSSEVTTKEIVEHAYNAGASALMAFRTLAPKVPVNSRAMREFRNVQKELLLTARSIIDSQISFLERMEQVSGAVQKKEKLKKVPVKQKGD
jgi:hypothetical protein